MLAADGLQPTSKGKRVAFDVDGTTTVIDGPFAETKELVAGYSIWEVASMDEPSSGSGARRFATPR